jgi:hypothetical protein
MQHTRRWTQRLIPPALLLMAATLLPAPPSVQAVEVDLDLGDSLEQLSPGTFQRTALSNADLDGNAGSADLIGAVQLIPVGAITNWQSTTPLPQPRTDTATVYLNGRLYVIGGDAISGTSKQLTNSVISAQIQQDIIVSGTSTIDRRGEIVGTDATAWRNESPLPVAQDDGDVETIETAPRAQAAAAALPKDGGGYIYVVGGAIEAGSDRLSTVDVLVGTVSITGGITWSPGPPLDRDDTPYPIQASSAFVNTAPNGNTYLYVVGGLVRRLNAGSTQELGRRSVLRSLINTSTGALGAWERMQSDVPIHEDPDLAGELGCASSNPACASAGLWNSGVVVNRTFSADGLSYQDVVFAIGGQVGSGGDNPTPQLYTAKTFRGFIDADGNLVWDLPTTYVATLQQPIVAHSAATYNGNVYAIGGFPASTSQPLTPLRSTQASYVQDDSTLAVLNTDTRFEFVRNDNTIPSPRFNHGTTVVPAGPTRAYIYIVGGQSGSGGDAPEAASTIFYGIIGDDSQNVRYAPGGYYYSEAVDITQLANVSTNEGELKTLSWTASVTHTENTDVQLEYRYTTALSFPSNQPWIPITATLAPAGFGSVNGLGSANSAPLLGTGGQANPRARLVQFRARLSSGAGTSTPLLHKVAIKVAFPGAPNLKPDAEQPFVRLTDVVDNKPTLTGIQVNIVNRDSAEAPTRPAFFEEGGIFYVALYINPTQAPPPFGTEGDAYAIVSKSRLPADARVTIGSGTEEFWCRKGVDPCQRQEITDLFQTPGTYRVYAYVDQIVPEQVAGLPAGLVNEGPLNEGDNATLTALEFTIAAPDAPVEERCTVEPVPADCPVIPGDEVDPVDDSIRFPLIMKN